MIFEYFNFMRSIIFCLLLILGALQFKLFFGDSGLFQRRLLEIKLVKQTKENEQLLHRNRTMAAQIHELKTGDQALEEQARYELGMIKDNEVYYQFVEP